MNLKTTAAAAIAAVMMAGGAASAATVNPGEGVANVGAGGQWFTNFLFKDAVNTISALGTWTFNEARQVVGNAREWDFTVTMQNTSDAHDGGVNRLVGFGWDTTPSVTDVTTDVSLTENEENWFVSSGNTPGGLGNFQVCLQDVNTNNCTGGSGAGAGTNSIDPGETGLFSFTLTTADDTPLVFDRYYARFMSTGADGQGSNTFEGTASPIPLPAAGWLMLAGLGGLAALRRRKTV